MTVNAPASNIVTQYFGLGWVSKNSAIIPPNIYKEAQQKYGKGLGSIDFFKTIGKTTDVPNATLTVLLREARVAVIKLGAAISAGSGNITVVLDSTMYDASNNGPLRVGDDIMIPKAFLATGTTSDRAYRVMSITGSGAAAEYTCAPYAVDGNYYTVATQIATDVPSGTHLIIGANSFAVGTGQPAGQTDTWESMTFKPRLVKESIDLEGGQVAQMFHPQTGYEANKGLLSQAILQAEFALDLKEAKAFSFGEWSDNASTLVQTAEDGTTSNAIVSGGGLWPHADVYSSKLSYSGDFVLDNLYDVGILQQSFGVVAGGQNLLLLGPEIGRDTETAALDYIKSYSGGTDLLDKFQKKLGVDVQSFIIDGRTYTIWRPDELADPSSLGLNINGSYTYEMATTGLVVPLTTVTVGAYNGQKNVSIPGVQVGYVNHNGENRGRMMGMKKGVNGLGMGEDVSSDYDGIHFYLAAHMMGIFANPYQWVKIYKA